MKYVIVSTNILNGILGIHSDPVVANWVVKGLDDTRLRIITPKNCKLYHKIDRTWISANNAILNRWDSDVTFLENVNVNFSKTKIITEKRLILFDSLSFWAAWLKKKVSKFSVDDFPFLAQQAIAGSNPKTQHWHNWVLDYASIQNLTPEESYQELRLISESELDYRFRIGAFIEKWVNIINETSCENLLNDDFVNDLFYKMRIDFALQTEI